MELRDVWSYLLRPKIAIVILSELFVFAVVFTIYRHVSRLWDAQQQLHQQRQQEDYDDGEYGRDGPTVQIVVLGDIGRSPRMQYHAISLARHGANVEVIGYQESDMHPDMINLKIRITPIPPSPASLQTSNRLLFLALAPAKVLLQVFWLFFILGPATPRAKFMLVQNPPSIPTLAVANICCACKGTRLVIDWHNFGYTILGLKLGNSHALVVVSKLYERVFGRFAAAHFAVTDAMCRVLKRDFGVKAIALHDRPPKHFQPLSKQQKDVFLQRFLPTVDLRDSHGEYVALTSGKARLVVSATSWTADEDFSLFLDALMKYSSQAAADDILPRLLVVITGKGPQKNHYLREIDRLTTTGRLSHVTIRTAWLTMLDYALLLGSADLGVSLHTSSSGVDLPMKVVDMFGTGLPVLGWNKFEAWPELVTEGLNGEGFGNAGELADKLVGLFQSNGVKLEKLREGALRECERRWDDEWDPVAERVFGLVN